MLRLLNFRCSFCSSPLDETHLVTKALKDTLTGASLKTSKGMLKGSVEQRKVKPGSPAEANPYDVLTRRRKE